MLSSEVTRTNRKYDITKATSEENYKKLMDTEDVLNKEQLYI